MDTKALDSALMPKLDIQTLKEMHFGSINEYADRSNELIARKMELAKEIKRKMAREMKFTGDVEEDARKPDNEKILKTIAQREVEVRQRLGQDQEYLEAKANADLKETQIAALEADVQVAKMRHRTAVSLTQLLAVNDNLLER